MKRIWLGALVTLAVLSLVILGILEFTDLGAMVGLSYLPKKVTPSALKRVDPYWGLSGESLVNKDFSSIKAEQLCEIVFDSRTVWPKTRLPAGFDANQVMEAGRNPGLSVRRLQSQGLTGKGVAVAVIDKPLLPEHQEWAGRLTYIEVFPDDPRIKRVHFHGAACLTFLGGNTAGVAPDATLYYFAVPDNGKNVANYTVALEKLMAVNETLPEEKRIRLVSISDGFDPTKRDTPETQGFLAALRKAEDQGVHVAYCTDSYPIDFAPAGCLPGLNTDDPANYRIWLTWQKNGKLNKDTANRFILFPGDYRTYASVDGTDVYVFGGQGGVSWTCPYLVGLYALGRQVDPQVTIPELQEAIMGTATAMPEGPRLVNPEAFIARVKTLR